MRCVGREVRAPARPSRAAENRDPGQFGPAPLQSGFSASSLRPICPARCVSPRGSARARGGEWLRSCSVGCSCCGPRPPGPKSPRFSSLARVAMMPRKPRRFPKGACFRLSSRPPRRCLRTSHGRRGFPASTRSSGPGSQRRAAWRTGWRGRSISPSRRAGRTSRPQREPCCWTNPSELAWSGQRRQSGWHPIFRQPGSLLVRPSGARSGISPVPSIRSGRPPGPRIDTWRPPSGSGPRSPTLWSRPA